jgi:hypothetical protein
MWLHLVQHGQATDTGDLLPGGSRRGFVEAQIDRSGGRIGEAGRGAARPAPHARLRARSAGSRASSFCIGDRAGRRRPQRAIAAGLNGSATIGVCGVARGHQHHSLARVGD